MKILREALNVEDVLTPTLKQALKTTYRKLLEQDKIKELIDTINKDMGSDNKARIVAFLNDFGGINVMDYCGLSSRYFKSNPYITSIEISDNVTSIPSDCFAECVNLQNVTIPGSVTSIGARAFKNCSQLANVKIADGVKSIGAETFSDCDLTKITLPGSVVNLGRNVFNQSNLVIITPHRQGGNRLNLPSSDIDYYKAHLGQPDINTPMAPARVETVDGKEIITCGNCSYKFNKAPRCPECGQLIKY